jgi:hypothetical protein
MSSKRKISVLKRTDEEIQEIILRSLYELHQKSGTRTGSKLKLTEIKKLLKKENLSPKEIIRNLDYLIQNGWINEEREKYQFRKGRSIFNSERKFYKISSVGIDHFQGPSKFQKVESNKGINIKNIQGIIQIGEGNYVNANYRDLYQNLNLLNEEIKKKINFSDEEKLNFQADIETIKSQLSKLNPDKKIIKSIWAKLERLANVNSIASLFIKISKLIGPLI